MANGINQNLNGVDSITSIIGSETFLSLDTDIQNKIIDTVHNDKEKDGGVMGKFLGTKPANASMHIGFILCVLLVLLMGIDFVHSYIVNESINMDLVNTIVPVITLSIGYIFGKGSN
ncbi:MAG: hypothetical protein IJE09_07735 [Oscillospiraceae bacterium]|nr:hypothetical protein [Oscillospiraceae bacterium]